METYGYGLIPTCPLKEPFRLRLFFCNPFSLFCTRFPLHYQFPVFLSVSLCITSLPLFLSIAHVFILIFDENK